MFKKYNIYKYLSLLIFLLISKVDLTIGQTKIKLKPTQETVLISRHIYGQFAEHLGRSVYDGFYRKGKIRTDVVQALKQIKVPNLRWPGGCFADQYHWRDGLGIKAGRPKRINTTWGMVTEDNTFGTHEFLELCKLIGCEPYIAGNVGTGTPQEMSDWIEYLNFNGKSHLSDLRAKNGHPAPYNVSFWGVGNESWGCGGNMTPEYYVNLFKHYRTFCQDFPGTTLKPIVSGANVDDYHWTETVMKNIPARQMWGMSLHNYVLVTGKWPPSGSGYNFAEDEYFSALEQSLKMEELVAKHSAIMDKYDPKKRVALVVDEWGIWLAPEPGTNPAFLYQQNSLRDAIIAATTLNIFNNHADRVRMANLAQTVNVIHSLILTKGDEMLLTPTYYVFDLMKVHQDAKLVPLSVSSPDYTLNGKSIKAVNASASMKDGLTNITLVNMDPVNEISIEIDISGNVVKGQLLTGKAFNDINDFGKTPAVKIVPFSGATIRAGKLEVKLPSKSVVQLAIR